MRCRTQVLVLCLGVLGLALADTASLAQDSGPAQLWQGFDPGLAGAMETESQGAKPEPAKPFLGLATPITVDPMLGTTATSIPIQVPPGPNGLTPKPRVRYSSNNVTGPLGGDGPFGVGWELLGLSYIQRSTAHGVPLDYSQPADQQGAFPYLDRAGFVLKLDDRTIVLDTCLDPGTCKLWGASSEEVWLQARLDTVNNVWTVTDRNGLIYTYSAEPQPSWGWCVTSVRDSSGNEVTVQYGSIPIGGQWLPAAGKYPTQIDYGGNSAVGLPSIFHVAFDYFYDSALERISWRNGDWDANWLDVTAIRIWTDGYSSATAPDVTYQFSYTPDSVTGASLLSRVHLVLADPSMPAPPDTTFLYAPSQHGLAAPEALTFTQPVSGVPMPAAVGSFNGTTTTSGFLDIDGDGWSDFVEGAAGGLQLFLGVPGSSLSLFATTALTYDATVLADNNHKLIDMNGDGLPDLVTANTADCQNPSGATCKWAVAVAPAFASDDPPSWSGVPADLHGWIPQPLPPDHSGTPSAQLIDLNGDRLPDILDCNGWNATNRACTFYRNNGHGFDGGVPWRVPNADIPSGGGFRQAPLAGTQSVQGGSDAWSFVTKQIIDMNGDGLPDLTSQEFGGNAPRAGVWDIWYNTGSGFEVSNSFWRNASSWLRVDHHVGACGVLCDPSCPQDPSCCGIVCWPVATETLCALRDMNGDGLPDYVCAPELYNSDGAYVGSSTPWTVALNTGASFTTPTPGNWPGTAGMAVSRSRSDCTSWSCAPTSSGTSSDDVLDVNGDGIADHISSSGSNQFSAALGTGSRPDLLVGMDNGLGASWEVTYAPYVPAAGGPGIRTIVPFPTWIVQRLTAHSGFSGTGNDLETDYEFTDGMFDPVMNQFRGFRHSTETRAGDGRQVFRYFDPYPVDDIKDPAWPESPLHLTEEDTRGADGTWLRSKTIQWGGADLGQGRTQLHPVKQAETRYGTAAGSPSKWKAHSFDSYDQYNNVTAETVSADDVNPTQTQTTYWPTASCHALPQTVQTIDRNGFVWSENDFTYDDNTCDRLSVGARWAAAGAPATSGTPVTTRYVYDTNADPAAATGQPTRVIDPRGNPTDFRYTCNQSLYPCDITNALQQTTHSVYDLRWGKPLSVTDPNQVPTSYAYDGMGRLKNVTKLLDSTYWRQYVYQYGEPGTGGASPTPSRAETFVRELSAAGGFRHSDTFFDSFGRALETKQEGIVKGTYAVVVTDAVTFDAVGRVYSRAAAFLGTQPIDTYEQALNSAGLTLQQYDALDRITRTTNTDGTYHTSDFSVAGLTLTRDENATASDDGKTTNVSGAGLRQQELHDGLGRPKETREYDGATLNDSSLRVRTGVTYDALGRVATVTSYKTLEDTGGSTVTFSYDSLGRRTGVLDPDSGPWTYQYDAAGNLIYQDDPKISQHLEFCYDALNRVRCRFGFTTGDAPVAETLCPTSAAQSCEAAAWTAVPIVLADYTYDTYVSPLDSTFTCGAGVGRLCRVDDPSGWTSYSYNARGQVTGSEKTITAAGDTKTFTSQFEFDAADHPTSVLYPTDRSTERLVYGYDAGGQLISALTDGQVYVAGSQYDRFGRPTSQTVGSGVTNSWTYFDGSPDGPANQFRLRETAVALGTSVYQKFNYGPYDKVGNLEAVVDNRAAYPSSYRYAAASARDAGWTYQYDGLGRLTEMTPKATTTWGTAGAFSYDAYQNLTGRSGLVLTPDDTQPHHVAYSTPPGTSPPYDYDPNGSLRFRPDTDGGGPDSWRFVVYDVEGHVQQVTFDGGSVQLLYDYTGTRVSRIASAGNTSTATFHFGRWFDITGTQLTRHVYAGDRRIAQSAVTLNSTSPLLLTQVDTGPGAVLIAGLTPEALLRHALGEHAGAAKLGVLVLAILVLVAAAAGRVRLGLATGATGIARWWCRRQTCVGLLLGLSLTLGGTPPVRAQCGGAPPPGPPPAPSFPVYFVHTDHLGSTTLLTCYKQSSCANGLPAAYFRYDAYGTTKAFTVSGGAVAAGSEKTDRLYTGQRWDAADRLYDYGARFYDPQIGRFLTRDPALEYTKPKWNPVGQFPNPYAYVKWNPLTRVDPTGKQDYSFLNSGNGVSPRPFETSTLGDEVAPIFAQLNATVGSIVNGMQARLEMQVEVDLRTANRFLFHPTQSEQAMMLLAVAVPPEVGTLLLGGGEEMGPALGLTGENQAFRFVGAEEAAIIRETGTIPNVTPAQKLKNIFFTNQPFTSASEAERILGLPSTPSFRIEFDIRNAQPIWGAVNEEGGTEFITPNPIPVDPNLLIPLEP